MTVLKVKSGAGGTWEEVGGVGIGVPAGGTTGQVLTKTSAADYATAWASNQPILSNASYLQGYKADGTTAQNLIGVTPADNISVGTGLATGKSVTLANGVWLSGVRSDATLQNMILVNTDNSVHVAYQPPQTLYIGDGALGDIRIGSNLAAGKNIYVPRLTVQGTLTVQNDTWITSSSGLNIITPSGTTLWMSDNCNAAFNSASGMTTFFRDVRIDGVLYKGGVAYTHPDFVFEHFYTGGITQFLGAHGAPEYRGLPSLDAVEAHTRETLRLPGARGEKYDLFARGDELLAEVERLYLHVFSLNRRVKELEAR